MNNINSGNDYARLLIDEILKDDDEVFELADTNLYDGGKNYGVLAFAKAIEQALREKNHG